MLLLIHAQTIYPGLGHGKAWWRHQMETFFALLALCEGYSPVTDKFTSQRPVRRSFDVFFDLRLNKRLSKQSWGWWFETPSRSLWRHCNGNIRSFQRDVIIHQYLLQWRFSLAAIEMKSCANNHITYSYVNLMTYPCPNCHTVFHLKLPDSTETKLMFAIQSPGSMY